MVKERIYQYDLIKAVAIVLVILYHYGTLDHDFLQHPHLKGYILYFFSGISTIGVPLFFMVNGALLLNRNCDLRKHLLKTCRIFLLFLFWSVLTLVLTSTPENEITSYTQFVKTMFLLEQYRTKHLWFLQAIIYINLLFPFLKALYDKPEPRNLYYLVAVLFIFTFGNKLATNLLDLTGYITGIQQLVNRELIVLDWINPFNFYCSFALLYFVLGGVLITRIKQIPYHGATYALIILLALALLFGVGVIKSEKAGYLYDSVWDGYNTVMALAMSVAVFVMAFRTNVSSARARYCWSLVGANTLGIYLLHVPLGFWLTGFYKTFALSNNTGVDILYTLLLVLLSLAATLVLKRIPLLRQTIQL